MLAIQPEKIHEATDEELSDAYEKLNYIEKEVKPEKDQIKEEMMERLGPEDAGMFGKCAVSKVRKPNYDKANIEKARDLGATLAVVRVDEAQKAGLVFKEILDNSMIKKLFDSGADLAIPVTEFIKVTVTGAEEEV